MMMKNNTHRIAKRVASTQTPSKAIWSNGWWCYITLSGLA